MGRPRRALWVGGDGASIEIIDQTKLPYAYETRTLRSVADVANAIRTMEVRGAPLIGIAAAYGMWFAMREDASVERSYDLLLATRPTAVNLRWALDDMKALLLGSTDRVAAAKQRADEITEYEASCCRQIGEHGLRIFQERLDGRPAKGPLNVLTHCNAGWLATMDCGTALAPIYKAHEAGLPVHVWVDETRPRNQGMLTAWELSQAGIPHTLIVDNEAGLLMQRGQVDLCIVGADRVTAKGDVCNKIGTYLKAVAARDNGIPFWAAMPASTIDWTLDDASAIPIEERGEDEVHVVRGARGEVRVTPQGTAVLNHAFDVTPARLLTGLITERGSCGASAGALAKLFERER